MVVIYYLSKTLDSSEMHFTGADISLRNYEGDQDIAAWLFLRREAMKNLSPPVGDWTAEHFRREFLAKPTWNAGNFWIAGTEDAPYEFTGSVALSLRKRRGLVVPSIQWLLVHPNFQRQGIASYLLCVLENRVRELGYHEIHLETHSGWTAAVEFYRKHGYKNARNK